MHLFFYRLYSNFGARTVSTLSLAKLKSVQVAKKNVNVEREIEDEEG